MTPNFLWTGFPCKIGSDKGGRTFPRRHVQLFSSFRECCSVSKWRQALIVHPESPHHLSGLQDNLSLPWRLGIAANTWQQGSSGRCNSTLAQSGLNYSLSRPALSAFPCRVPECKGQAGVTSQTNDPVPFIRWCLESTEWHTRHYAGLGNERKRHNDNFSFQFSVQGHWSSVHTASSAEWGDCTLLWHPYLKLLHH